MTIRTGLFIFLIFCSRLPAQTETGHNISLLFGISDFHLRDDHASPLFFSSTGINPSLRYIFNGLTFSHSVELSYFQDYLKSNVPNFNSDNWRGKIKYAYLISLTEWKISDQKLRLSAGPSVSSYLSLSDYRIGEGLAIKSWYWHHSINLELKTMYIINDRNSWTARILFPLVSNISRPAYSPSEDYNYSTNQFKIKSVGKMVYFPANFFLNLILTWHTTISAGFGFQLDYEFFYSSYDKPKDVKMFMNNLRAGVSLCL
jgi:hypothetical protein